MFTSTNLNEKFLQFNLQNSLQIIRKFDWLINSYVLDFYVDDHWANLPQSWKHTFQNLNPDDLSELLSDRENTKLWPLSLLALKASLKRLCVPREVKEKNLRITSPILLHPKLKNIFTKCVKPKKRHEIERMAKLTSDSCAETGVQYIVDFGAGLGHLSRVLSYGYGLRVCCLEMQNELNEQARVIDKHLETMAGKYLPLDETKNLTRPVHVTMKLSKTVTAEDFLSKIKEKFKIKPTENLSFGIIGLHPCGDLGAILIRMFLTCPDAKFLNIAGCCYMKLSTADTEGLAGYPMSRFLKDLPFNATTLSYESREISCHAMEMYEERLRNGIYEDLKIHSYRATLEDIIVRNWPEKRHSGVRSVKHTKDMTFEQYCKKAIANLYDDEIPQSDIYSNSTIYNLNRWKLVVIFYTLRLMFAPLVESIILYDRILFLTENECHAEINAVFDPNLSPRNHITKAMK